MLKYLNKIFKLIQKTLYINWLTNIKINENQYKLTKYKNNLNYQKIF